MVERAPQPRHDEQYPLLKVAGGGGDGGVHHQPPQALPGPGWGVTCAPKKSWSFRWPEYISTCWMTLILFGISFLVFYALGMEVYRRQAILIIKCNATKPASDVYYHHIVRRGSACPFMLYADYLSNVATQYPSLHFHVIFLVDDSLYPTAYHGQRIKLFKNFIPRNPSYPFVKVSGTDGRREIADFERKHQNVNVTIMSINKFMSRTPSMIYNWKSIPLSYMSFYMRVISVWENGGVAMDLNHFNNYFINRKCVDRRISAILKQHNDGIKVEEYTNALNKIDREEEFEFFNIFYGLVHQILNETRTFFTKSFQFPQITAENGGPQSDPIIHTNRHKRDAPTLMNDNKNNKSEAVSNVYVETINSTKETDLKKNEYQLSNPDVALEKLKLTINDAFKSLQMNTSNTVNGINKTEGLNKSDTQTEMNKKPDSPQVVLFYDFSVFSDGSAAPSYVVPKTLIHNDFRQNKKNPDFVKAGKSGNEEVQLLAIDSDGMFVAASSRLHPFLGHLISAGPGCQRVRPKYAIQDTLLTQCSGLFTEDSYCNNIYLL
ncbi:hypothetical protein PYW08_016549 [Mythimna loreyi]|uniref:Uncharacterized protein n=1 Tax=Mythimna loreyi TaxID=667449 RepID=A0ACC2R2I9_9NEOP|nr:hypothetical protein PYW08_016549 [Mythimna loreyi]